MNTSIFSLVLLLSAVSFAQNSQLGSVKSLRNYIDRDGREVSALYKVAFDPKTCDDFYPQPQNSGGLVRSEKDIVAISHNSTCELERVQSKKSSVKPPEIIKFCTEFADTRHNGSQNGFFDIDRIVLIHLSDDKKSVAYEAVSNLQPREVNPSSHEGALYFDVNSAIIGSLRVAYESGRGSPHISQDENKVISPYQGATVKRILTFMRVGESAPAAVGYYRCQNF